MNVEIVQGRIVDPASNLDAAGGIYIANGRIAGIGPAPEGFRADRTLDARGAVIAPGLVDLCARLREPGRFCRTRTAPLVLRGSIAHSPKTKPETALQCLARATPSRPPHPALHVS